MVMVEGGQGMLNALSNHIQWYLIFQSPHDKEGEAVVLPEGLEYVSSQKVGEDTMTWYFKHGE